MTNSLEDANFIAKYISNNSGYLTSVTPASFCGDTEWTVVVSKNCSSLNRLGKVVYIPFRYKTVRVKLKL